MTLSITKKRRKVAIGHQPRRKAAAPDAQAPICPVSEVRRARGRPKRISDAEQELAIVRKTRDLFLERGFARTTMDEIVAHCHISKSTIYRFFPNKIDILGAVIDDHRQSMLALPGDYDDLPIDVALGKIFRIDIDDSANRERMALIRLIVVEAEQFPELHDLLRERGAERSRRELADWLGAQARRGRIAVPNADDAAKALMDLMFGAVALKSKGEPQWPSRKERKRYLGNCIAMFTNGIVARPG